MIEGSWAPACLLMCSASNRHPIRTCIAIDIKTPGVRLEAVRMPDGHLLEARHSHVRPGLHERVQDRIKTCDHTWQHTAFVHGCKHCCLDRVDSTQGSVAGPDSITHDCWGHIGTWRCCSAASAVQSFTAAGCDSAGCSAADVSPRNVDAATNHAATTHTEWTSLPNMTEMSSPHCDCLHWAFPWQTGRRADKRIALWG